MLTTVTAFALAGAKFTHDIILKYAEQLASKLIKKDKDRQKIIFDTVLSDSNLQPELISKRNKLHEILRKLNEKLYPKIEKKFEIIYKKARYFSFLFGIFSASLIFLSGFYAGEYIVDQNIFLNYIFVGTLFFAMLSFYYDDLPRNAMKAYILATLALLLLFLMILFKFELLAIIFLFTLLLLNYVNKLILILIKRRLNLKYIF